MDDRFPEGRSPSTGGDYRVPPHRYTAPMRRSAAHDPVPSAAAGTEGNSSGNPAAVTTTDLPLPGKRSGKVRDCYNFPPGTPGTDRRPRLLIVATDRISAFDVILPTPIPGKGRLLTRMAARWFEVVRTSKITPDHLISVDFSDLRAAVADRGIEPALLEPLEGRFMICRATKVVPIECVVRGYLAGSGWLEYEQTGRVCGIPLPAGLVRCQKLDAPIFTPATKAEEGHDENISFDAACAVAGEAVMHTLRERSLAIYRLAHERAAARGLVLADTKFEFGVALDEGGAPTGELLLIDEILTPDSSRYWPADQLRPGEEPPSFDKQFVRNYLLERCAAGEWDRTPPGPPLPQDVVARTIDRYESAYRQLFG